MTNEVKVLVAIREGFDAEALSTLVAVRCGGCGSSIARAVIAGNGKAVVPLSLVKFAVDTSDSATFFFDHFELFELKTSRPLVYFLIELLDTLKKAEQNSPAFFKNKISQCKLKR